MRALGLALVVCVVAAACGPSTNPPTPTPAAAPATVAPPTTGVPPTVPPEAAAVVDAAIADAASHLGVGRDTLRVDQVEAREWPDSSLGCPQSGQLYSQVVTPGFFIVISSGSHQLEYHTDNRARVTLCRET